MFKTLDVTSDTTTIHQWAYRNEHIHGSALDGDLYRHCYLHTVAVINIFNNVTSVNRG